MKYKNPVTYEKRVHKGWIEFQKIKKQKGLKELLKRHPMGCFGKWQYIFKSNKGEISLIQLLGYDFETHKDVWEIYELSANNLVDDTERFPSMAKAENRIMELLR